MQNDPLLAWVHVQSGRQRSGSSSLKLSDAGSGGSGFLAGAGGGSSGGSLPLGPRAAVVGNSGSGLGAELQRWHLQYSDLVIQRPLGEGSFGKVRGGVPRRGEEGAGWPLHAPRNLPAYISSSPPPMPPPHPPQVYLATWHQTLVAVKLLLAADSPPPSPQQAGAEGGAGGVAALSTFLSPVMEALQKVRWVVGMREGLRA